MKDVKSMTIEEVRQLLSAAEELRRVLNHDIGKPSDSNGGDHPWVGKNVFIRTVTYHYTGKVEEITDTEIELSAAAWIADNGRFATALESGTFLEVEPYPEQTKVRINRGSIVDWSIWEHSLPREQK